MKQNLFKMTGAAAVLVSLGVLGAIALQSPMAPRPVPEKICPITFQLYPGTLLEKNYAARIEHDNAVLSTFLGEMRSTAGLIGGIKTWAQAAIHIDKSNPVAMSSAVNDLYGILKAKGAANPFVGTYLADPSLTKESGETVTGLPAVLLELARLVEGSTYVDAQSVCVALEYLPFGSPQFKEINAKYPPKPGETEIDIVAHIKTVLAYAPKDDPVTIEGPLPHRKICDPI